LSLEIPPLRYVRNVVVAATHGRRANFAGIVERRGELAD